MLQSGRQVRFGCTARFRCVSNNGSTGRFVRAIEVDAALASLRILPRPVLDVVLRPIVNLLTVYAHRAVAVHAADIICRCVAGFGDSDFLPAPLVLSVD